MPALIIAKVVQKKGLHFICRKAGENVRIVTHIFGKGILKDLIDHSFPKNLSRKPCFKSFWYRFLYFAALGNHIVSRIRSFCCRIFPSQYLELEKVIKSTSYFPIKKPKQITDSKTVSSPAAWSPQIGEKMISTEETQGVNFL